jgi:hypothetical protein
MQMAIRTLETEVRHAAKLYGVPHSRFPRWFECGLDTTWRVTHIFQGSRTHVGLEYSETICVSI